MMTRWSRLLIGSLIAGCLIGLAGLSVTPARAFDPTEAAEAVEAPAPPPEAPAAGQVGVRTITVNGVGTASARPDQVTVDLATEAQASTAVAAMADNARRIDSVIDAVRGVGIPSDNIQTTGINLFPIRSRNGEAIEGYRAVASIRVRVPDVDRAGAVIDAAIQAGAGQVSGIQFGLSDPADLRDRALRAAVADARRRADALADAIGVQITGVEAIIETGATPPPQPRAAAPAAAVAPGDAAPPIEPGQLTVRASVSVTFSY